MDIGFSRGISVNASKKTWQKELPHISIVTVVFNGEKYIEQTMLSVLNQTYTNIDYIIIDGASTDGTIGLIKKYEDKITFWRSELDMGIYYAMNKGINCVVDRDSYILFLNSDDYLFDNTTIEKVVKKFNDEDFIYGKIQYKGSSSSYLIGKELNYEKLPFSMIQHQATFIKRSLFDNLGFFNTKYKIAADYDFAIRQMKSKFNSKFIDEVVAVMRTGGIGSQHFIATLREKRRVISDQYKGNLKICALLFFNFYEMPKYLVNIVLRRFNFLLINLVSDRK